MAVSTLTVADKHISFVVSQLKHIKKYAEATLQGCGILADFEYIASAIADTANIAQDLNDENLSELAKSVELNSDNYVKWLSPKYITIVNALRERDPSAWLQYKQFNNIMNKKKPDVKAGEPEPENATNA